MPQERRFNELGAVVLVCGADCFFDLLGGCGCRLDESAFLVGGVPVKRQFFLVHEQARRNAVQAVQEAPDGYCVEVKQKTRSLDQNARMWAMLGELSRHLEWHGQYLTPENWKDMCTAALKRQQVVPGIDGGFVVMGTSTRRMTVGEMSELIEFIAAFGAQHGVAFADHVAEVYA